ncbi:hypothetical protein HDU99_002610 [Rhizoclosmatium hyalinum]|nr:hypothetical protein HDU99_002610 [Rhizoclosmatium hyalinum]
MPPIRNRRNTVQRAERPKRQSKFDAEDQAELKELTRSELIRGNSGRAVFESYAEKYGVDWRDVQRYVQNYWQRCQEKKKKVLEQALVTVGPNAQTNGMLSNLSQPISAPTPSTITTSATLAATSLNCPSCTSCAAKDEIIAGLRAHLPANPSGLVHRVPPPNGRAIVTKNPEPSFYRAYLAVKGNESSNEVFQRHAANCPEPFSDTGRVQKGQLFGMSLLISEAKVDDKTEYKRMMEDVTGEYAELKEKVNAELQRQKANHQSETLLPLSNRKYSEYHDRAVDNLQLAIDDAGKLKPQY